jgi:hypothetical protein
VCAGYLFQAAARAGADPEVNARRMDRARQAPIPNLVAVDWGSGGAFRGLLTGSLAHLHPESACGGSGGRGLAPPLVVCHEVGETLGGIGKDRGGGASLCALLTPSL